MSFINNKAQKQLGEKIEGSVRFARAKLGGAVVPVMFIAVLR
jgi:hypothetical protein